MGANPRDPLRVCSLAIRASLTFFVDKVGAPPVLVVDLSGGTDSLALALTTIDMAARAGVPVVVVIVDHGLRAGSGERAHRVTDRTEFLRARVVVKIVSVEGPSRPEDSARDARRAALRAVVQREGVPILLGHTMDDQAEAILLRLARGSDPSSLWAIAPVPRDDDGVTWLCPLLGLRRTDTEQACAQTGLTPIQDPTNNIDEPWRAADGSPLRCSALCHAVIPASVSALGVDPVPAPARMAVLCAADDDASIQWAGAIAVSVAPGAEYDSETGYSSLVVSGPLGAPRAVRTRALREAARVAGIHMLSSTYAGAPDNLVVVWRGQGLIDLPGGTASRAGRGAYARIAFTVRGVGAPTVPDPA